MLWVKGKGVSRGGKCSALFAVSCERDRDAHLWSESVNMRKRKFLR
jgi:hypothetical protein